MYVEVRHVECEVYAVDLASIQPDYSFYCLKLSSVTSRDDSSTRMTVALDANLLSH